MRIGRADYAANLYGARTPAGRLLDATGRRRSGVAFDFVEKSALVRNPGKFQFSGDPVDLLTYSSPSKKIVFDSDGYAGFTGGNIFINSDVSSNFPSETNVVNTVVGIRPPHPDYKNALFKLCRANSGVTGALHTQDNNGNWTSYIEEGQSLEWEIVMRLFGANESGNLFVQLNTVSYGASGVTQWDLSDGSVKTTGADEADAGVDIGNGFKVYRFRYKQAADRSGQINLAMRRTTGDPTWNEENGGTGTDGDEGFYFGGFCVRPWPSVDRRYYGTTGSVRFGLPVDHDPEDGNKEAGIRIEGSGSDVCFNTYSRDLTGAAWSGGSNITPTKDQTGIDNVANSASRLTADAANGTISQSITDASDDRQLQVFVKRVTGTGTVYISMDGGTTQTDIASIIDGGVGDYNGYHRISIQQAAVTNPVIEFEIVTSGDEIAVDFVNLIDRYEATKFTPIWTEGAQVTRAADVLSLAAANVPYKFGDAFTAMMEAQNRAPDNNAGTATNTSFLMRCYGSSANNVWGINLSNTSSRVDRIGTGWRNLNGTSPSGPGGLPLDDGDNQFPQDGGAIRVAVAGDAVALRNRYSSAISSGLVQQDNGSGYPGVGLPDGGNAFVAIEIAATGQGEGGGFHLRKLVLMRGKISNAAIKAWCDGVVP